MEHVVFYPSSQGTPAFRRVSSLADAVTFAEHLRNVEGVTDFSVYSLSPVTLSLRAYYHVEVAGEGASAAEPAAPAHDDAPLASTAPAEPPPSSGTPFTAAPLTSPPAAPSALQATADESLDTGAPLPATAVDTSGIDPSVVDPTVEEVVPTGRRSMGFFARP